MSTQTQLSNFAISEKVTIKDKKQKKANSTKQTPYIFNEKEFKKMFGMRCGTLKKKTPLQKEDIDALWEKVVTHYESGFFCEYCGEFLSIHAGSKNVFSFDHKDNDYPTFKIEEISIVRLGCNLFKRNICKKNFEALIFLFRKIGKMSLYDEIKNEIVNGLAEGKARAEAKGIHCHRPRKNIDLNMVMDKYNAGIPLTLIAEIFNVSYSTLRNRLRESTIKLEQHVEKK